MLGESSYRPLDLRAGEPRLTYRNAQNSSSFPNIRLAMVWEFYLSLSLSLSWYSLLMKVTEQVLRSDSRIERLLKNPIWRPTAEAAMAFYLQGKDCPIASWQRSSTWAQVKMVWEDHSKK